MKKRPSVACFSTIVLSYPYQLFLYSSYITTYIATTPIIKVSNTTCIDKNWIFKRFLHTDLSICLLYNIIFPLKVIVSGSSAHRWFDRLVDYYRLYTERSVRSSVGLRRRSRPPGNLATLTNVNRFFIIYFFYSPVLSSRSNTHIGFVIILGDERDRVLGRQMTRLIL